MICFVEAWRQHDEPTVKALVAEARAFVELCVMDRAWTRLSELAERGKGGVDVVVLTARMYLERGWRRQARELLQKAMGQGHDEQLEPLWERASQPDDESDAPPPPNDDDHDGQLRHARRLMAAGAFVRAKGVLERLKKRRPDNERIDDLLWVMAGDFSLSETSLSALAERYGPDLATLHDLPRDPDRTESNTLDEPLEPLSDDDVSGAFPSLFRGLEPPTEAYGGPAASAEVTAITSMADFGHTNTSGETDPAKTDDGAEDTQVLKVIHRQRESSYESLGEAAKAHDDPSFDLAAFRREMGMKFAESDLAAAPEKEDDDVIILTRRERIEPDPTTDVEVIALSPLSDVPTDTTGIDDSEAFWIRPPPKPRESAAPAPTPAESSKPAPRRPTTWPWWVAGAAAVVLLGGAALLVILTVYFWA